MEFKPKKICYQSQGISEAVFLASDSNDGKILLSKIIVSQSQQFLNSENYIYNVGDMLSTLDLAVTSMFSASLIVEYQSFGLIEIINI